MAETYSKAVITELGGFKRTAEALQVHPDTVRYWVRNDQIPAEYCLAVEMMTGGKFACEEIRPDVFDSDHVAKRFDLIELS